MKGNLEAELLEYGGLMKRGVAAAIGNAGKIIALIAAAVSVLVIFTDVTFAGAVSGDLCSTLLLLLISSYVIYFSLEDAGERLGEESEEYRGAKEGYRAVLSRIRPDMIPALRGFCKRYAAEEARFRRESLLAAYGYTAEELSEYQNGSDVSKKARRVLKRAARIRPVALTPAMLMSPIKAKRNTALGAPRLDKAISCLTHLLPSTVCTFFTVSVILSLKPALDVAAVIDGILKLSALPVIAFKGYTAGYYHMRDSEAGYITAKTGLLEAFLAEDSAKL